MTSDQKQSGDNRKVPIGSKICVDVDSSREIAPYGSFEASDEMIVGKVVNFNPETGNHRVVWKNTVQWVNSDALYNKCGHKLRKTVYHEREEDWVCPFCEL